MWFPEHSRPMLEQRLMKQQTLTTLPLVKTRLKEQIARPQILG
jgi:hypothetical protein